MIESQLLVSRSLALVLAVAAGACNTGANPGVGVTQADVTAGPGGKGCFDPADYGAIPDDGVDDRAAAQHALDDASVAGGTVCFGSGHWRLSRAPVGSYNRFAGLSTHGKHLAIRGTGPGTVLEVVGDQGAADMWVIALDPGATDITIADLTIDTSGMTNTDEQTHAIEVGSGVCSTTNGTCSQPVSDIRIERVAIVHPPSPDGQRKGDCFRMVGNTPDTRVQRVTILGSSFTSCARSGIAIQRNVFDLAIIGNQFTAASDQDIDSEPTGGATDLNATTEIIGNIFRDDVTLRPAAAQGDWSVTVVGAGGPMSRVVVANNIFEGRGLDLYRSGDIAITGNTFFATMSTGYGVIESENVTRRTIIAHNTIDRMGVAGPLINVLPHSGGMPGDFTVSGNVLVQESGGGGIHIEGATDFSILDNRLKWTSPAAAGSSGIYLRTTTQAADGIVISGNQIAGNGLAYGILLAAAPNPIGDVTLVGNQLRGTTVGLYCTQTTAGLFPGPITSTGNRFGTVQCPLQTFTAGN
jgi:hypothetical protein